MVHIIHKDISKLMEALKTNGYDIDCYMLDELLRLSRRLEKLDSLEEV